MITASDLFTDMLGLRSIFDDFFTATTHRYTNAGNYPVVNVYHAGDAVEVRALVPGVTADTITLELVDRDLVIKGARTAANEQHVYIRREREFGEFTRSVRLPIAVDRDSITATLKDGVLRVTLAASEAAKPKRIAIQ